jgi:hypothetical protein
MESMRLELDNRRQKEYLQREQKKILGEKGRSCAVPFIPDGRTSPKDQSPAQIAGEIGG